MAIKQTGQWTLLEALLAKGAGSNRSLEQLSTLAKWYRFEKLIGHLRREETLGRPGWSPLLLFKALLLQSLYGLSDRELEEALRDRLSFRRFIGVSLDSAVPDHTVLNRFRNELVAAGLLEKLFGELDRQLEKAGMILKRGTMLDATLIQTAAARPPMGGGDDEEGEEAVDPDAAFTRRAGKAGSHYGYKAHVGVDEGSGLIRSVLTTPANVNDTVPADLLIRWDEKAVLGDAAYHTRAREKALRERGIKARLCRRPNKHHPELPARLKRYNRLIARRRAAVETTFATLKRRMGLTVIRYAGLAKASGQVLMAAIAFNLLRWTRLQPA
jgi:IS5 family transposase